MSEQLASVGDSLKIWSLNSDSSRYSLISSYSNGDSNSYDKSYSNSDTYSSSFSNNKYNCLSWNHTNQVVAIGGTQPNVELIQADNGQLLSSLKVNTPTITNTFTVSTTITNLSFSTNSRYLSVALSNTIQLWDLKKRQIKSILSDHRDTVTSTVFTTNGELISADKSGAFRIWDAKTYISSEEIRLSSYNTIHNVGSSYSNSYDNNSLSVGITTLQLSPLKETLLAVGYTDGSIGIWDPLQLQLLRRLTAHKSAVTSLSYSPRNARLVATSGSDGRVVLIDTGSKDDSTASAAIDLAGESVNTISFKQDGIHCAVGTQSGRLLVYDWRKVQTPVLELEGSDGHPINQVSFQLSKSSAKSTKTESVRSSIESSSLQSRKEDSFSSRSIPVHSTTPERKKLVDPMVNNPLATTRIPRVLEKHSVSTINSDTVVGSVHSTNSSAINSSAVNSPAIYSPPVNSTITKEKESTPITRNSRYTDRNSATDYDNLPSVARHSTPNSVGASHSVGNSTHTMDDTVTTESKKDLFNIDMEISTKKTMFNYHTEKAPTNTVTMNEKEESFATIGTTGTKVTVGTTDTPGTIPTKKLDAMADSMRPVTAIDLEEAISALKYDIHVEVQEIIKEQARQFMINKDDVAALIKDLSKQLADVLRANEKLRQENEYLRRIY